jgi:hypothetical protein
MLTMIKTAIAALEKEKMIVYWEDRDEIYEVPLAKATLADLRRSRDWYAATLVSWQADEDDGELERTLHSAVVVAVAEIFNVPEDMPVVTGIARHMMPMQYIDRMNAVDALAILEKEVPAIEVGRNYECTAFVTLPPAELTLRQMRWALDLHNHISEGAANINGEPHRTSYKLTSVLQSIIDAAELLHVGEDEKALPALRSRLV